MFWCHFVTFSVCFFFQISKYFWGNFRKFIGRRNGKEVGRKKVMIPQKKKKFKNSLSEMNIFFIFSWRLAFFFQIIFAKPVICRVILLGEWIFTGMVTKIMHLNTLYYSCQGGLCPEKSYFGSKIQSLGWFCFFWTFWKLISISGQFLIFFLNIRSKKRFFLEPKYLFFGL